ncbi:MAG TPA: VOC family protein [Thermoleophilaceae bacterium]|nr:VOC family protein [Thermoleophilaceae bacterium]
MGERKEYAPGTFCWVDLATSDAEGAKAFYAALFGWQSEDMPSGPTGTYTLLKIGGDDVAALYEATESPHPAWLSYVAVEDAEATAGRLEELGGSVMTAPFEVGPVGRMAVVRDPQGAVFALWQAGSKPGAAQVNAPGALTLNQLNTSDPEAAQEFYRALFGWEIHAVEGGDVPYWGIQNQGKLNGGMMQLPPGSPAPPHWLTYFGSPDVEADSLTLVELGGQVHVQPMSVPGGDILVAQDPQGAVFGLFSGGYDD